MSQIANNPLVSPLVSTLKTLLCSSWFWLLLMAGQFALVQAITGVQYGDGARNLHWAMYTAAHPDFLLQGTTPYVHFYGFLPDPAELAPAGFARDEGEKFHRWWGPVPMVIMGGVWSLSGSLTLLSLVVPLIAGGTVLACYGLGRGLFDERTGLLTAAFVAFFPLFYQNAVISYSEAISAFFLLLALWSYMRGETVLTVLLGALTLLCKMDMAVVYGGVIGFSLLYRLRYQRDPRSLAHSLAALLLPGVALMTWYWVRTGFPLPTGTGRGLSFGVFQLLALDMLQNLFFIQWYGAVITLLVIGYAALLGLRSPRLGGEQRVILASWIGWGLFVLAVYMFTPGAGNTPRVLLPSLPALALLVVEGCQRMPLRRMRLAAIYLGALFLLTSGFVVYYIAAHMSYIQVHTDLWRVLREQPYGVVMSETCGLTIIHAGQPAAWFREDPQFQENILHHRDNFARYVTQHPIRYVAVPRPAADAVLSDITLLQLQVADLYSEEVLRYLQEQGRHIAIPPYYDLYVLPAQ